MKKTLKVLAPDYFWYAYWSFDNGGVGALYSQANLKGSGSAGINGKDVDIAGIRYPPMDDLGSRQTISAKELLLLQNTRHLAEVDVLVASIVIILGKQQDL